MIVRTAVSFLALAALAGASAPAKASAVSPSLVLAQAATPLEVPPAPGGAATSPATSPDEAETPGVSDDDMADDDSVAPDIANELSLGEIPTIETIELTPDIAKRALDTYLSVREKYANTDLDQFEDLQDFVDKTEDGRAFEADIKAAGFVNVSDWNLAISTLTLTYSSLIDDQTAELQQQISEVENDTELAQDMKDKMVKALKSLIPSANNKTAVAELMKDPEYGPKLKQIDTEEE